MRTLSEGLKTTFQALAETKNEAAVGVLIPALDSPYEAIRRAALATLLARRSPRGHREVISRLDRLDDQDLSTVAANPHRMTQALRDAVLSGDARFFQNGCRAAIWFREYDLVPALITALEDAGNPNGDRAAATLLELVGLLYGELASVAERSGGRDPQVIRRRVVGALEVSVRRYGRHKRREVIEAFVLLARRDNALLRQILEDPHHVAFVSLVEALSGGRAGGVIRLLLGFLDDPHAPSVVLSVVGKRTDLELVRYLLKKVGHEPSKVVRQNLRRITAIGWIGEGIEHWDALDDACQHAVVQLVMASGISRRQAFLGIRHVLLQGGPRGRRAAAQALDAFQGVEANELALRGLEDEDPLVQARVLVQLRRRGIPGALTRLVDRVDSPHAAVRAAVRESLSEFSFPRFLAAFDMLDDEVRRSTGKLVQKLDPQTVPLLEAELASPMRTRRLRAVAIVQSLEVVDRVEGTLIELLGDEDHMVRAQAAAALGQSGSASSHEALVEVLQDRSGAVQEAARKSLAQRGDPQAGSTPKTGTVE